MPSTQKACVTELLTTTEAAELVEHLQDRQDLWREYANTWFRADRWYEVGPIPAIQLALRIAPVADGWCVLVARPHARSLNHVERYVEWLLAHYTRRAERLRVEAIVKRIARPNVDVDAVVQELLQ
jgi:diadenosine tetraphosphate (Ap4A) HIT family hydrolase